MRPGSRRAFFILAVLIFVILAPLLILAASGYRYDFSGSGLVQTGALVIKTVPPGAKVFINRQEQKGKTPFKIEGLLPERYQIAVESEGFQAWEKELEVQESRVTSVDGIFLIPKQLTLVPVGPDRIHSFALSPDKNHIVFARRESNRNDTLWIIDLVQDDAVPATRPLLTAPERLGRIEGIFWSPDSRTVVIKSALALGATHAFYMIGTAPGAESFQLPLFDQGEVAGPGWRQDGSNFFFLQRAFLYHADYTRRSVERLLPDKIRAYAFSEEALYFISSRTLYKQDLLSGERAEVIDIPSTAGENSTAEERLFITQDETILFHDSNNQLWKINADIGEIHATPVHMNKGTLSGDENQFLGYSGKAVFVYDLKANALAGPAMPLDFLQEIDGAVWSKDQGHILFAAKGGLYIMEEGEGGAGNLFPLIRAPGMTLKFAYDGGHTVYFLREDKLYSTDLSFLDGSKKGEGRL